MASTAHVVPAQYAFYEPLKPVRGSAARRVGYRACSLSDARGTLTTLRIGDCVALRAEGADTLLALVTKLFVERGEPKARFRWFYRAVELGGAVPPMIRGLVSRLARVGMSSGRVRHVRGAAGVCQRVRGKTSRGGCTGSSVCVPAGSRDARIR